MILMGLLYKAKIVMLEQFNAVLQRLSCACTILISSIVSLDSEGQRINGFEESSDQLFVQVSTFIP